MSKVTIIRRTGGPNSDIGSVEGPVGEAGPGGFCLIAREHGMFGCLEGAEA